MRAQRAKLTRMLGLLVTGLDRMDELLPAVRDLGRRHAGYGVRGIHYGAVGAALLWTLETTLRGELTAEAKDAWATVYGLLAQTMREAAARVPV